MIPVLRRLAVHLGRALLMIWVVTTLTFIIISVMPGDPVAAEYERLLSQGVTPESAAAQTATLARFQPTGSILEQYLQYMGSLLRFDLGQSIGNRVEVSTMLASATKWTVVPVLIGTVLSFGLGVGMGLYAAVKRSGRIGDVLAITGSLVNGIPPFIIALLLGSVFATVIPILPRSGAVDIAVDPGFTGEYLGSLAAHAVLPIATYLLTAYGGWILAMRSSVVTVLGDDFILAAELRGMKKLTVFRYIARNAILPLFTIFALSMASLFGGSVFIERVFNYPGLGMLLLDSIAGRDISVMAGALLLITVAIIIANIVADLLYSAIDPRVRRGGGA
ncbi:MAG: ABC transporter permease [Propionibacteriaceae bacterium]